MLTVTCVYCDSFVDMIERGAPGTALKLECPECKKEQWVIHHELESMSYKFEDIEVDEFKKKIRFKKREDTHG